MLEAQYLRRITINVLCQVGSPVWSNFVLSQGLLLSSVKGQSCLGGEYHMSCLEVTSVLSGYPYPVWRVPLSWLGECPMSCPGVPLFCLGRSSTVLSGRYPCPVWRYPLPTKTQGSETMGCPSSPSKVKT